MDKLKLNPLDECSPFNLETLATRCSFLHRDEHDLLDKIRDFKLRRRIVASMKFVYWGEEYGE